MLLLQVGAVVAGGGATVRSGPQVVRSVNMLSTVARSPVVRTTVTQVDRVSVAVNTVTVAVATGIQVRSQGKKRNCGVKKPYGEQDPDTLPDEAESTKRKNRPSNE